MVCITGQLCFLVADGLLDSLGSVLYGRKGSKLAKWLSGEIRVNVHEAHRHALSWVREEILVVDTVRRANEAMYVWQQTLNLNPTN